MRIVRPGFLLFCAAFASIQVGCKDCGGGGANPGPAASASLTDAAPVAVAVAGTVSAAASAARPRPPMVRASGTAGALFRAVTTLELKDDQKTALEKIATDLREAEKAEREAGDGGARLGMKEAHEELVAGVKSGKIDGSKLEPHYGALEKTLKARLDREAEALNRLHAALEPTQRAAAVANVRSLEEKRAARIKAHERPDAGKSNMSRLRLERYTRGLDLNPDQEKKVEAVLPKDDRSSALRDEAQKQAETVLAAFEKETFDAKKLEPNAAKQARVPMEEQVKFLGQLLPILTPEQREKLAKNLGRSADGGHSRPHRGLGMGDRAHGGFDDDDDGEVLR